MKLNINFNQEFEKVINQSAALSDWFSRNQERMAYLELTHAGCLHFENTIASYDNIVLGRMANACLTDLETFEEDCAAKAVNDIAEIYEIEKEQLTTTAKKNLFINTELDKVETNRKHR